MDRTSPTSRFSSLVRLVDGMRLLWLLALAACGHAAVIKWTRVPAVTAKNLTSVACTKTGDVYAIDDAGDLHDLRGHATPPAPDPAKVAAAKIRLPHTVRYGQTQIAAVARDHAHVYALGRFMAIGNSLEEDYAFLLRSDDGGATWVEVWDGPDSGPMSIGHRHDPEIGTALAVISSGVVLARTDGTVLISSDLGKTFKSHATGAASLLAALWASPTGALYGVGARGQIVVSSDGGESFDSMRVGDADLTAITGCGDEIWIVGARGTVLSRRSR